MKRRFNLQWHLTDACPNNCKHCYVKKEEKRKGILTLDECKRIVDDYKNLLEKWNCDGRITLTGGDPLLYPYFWQLCDYIKTTLPGIRIAILGNPELLYAPTIFSLTIEISELLTKLKKLDLLYYQMSLDGLEKTHDYIRNPGSFKRIINVIRLLKTEGIPTAVMFTVSKKNINQLLSVIDLVVSLKVDFFNFARYAPVFSNNSESPMEENGGSFIPPLEYRDLLCQVSDKYKEHNGCKTKLKFKDPLLALLDYEKGNIKLPSNPDKIICSGCHLGGTNCAILKDGTILACRRVPIAIGKVPDENLMDIFIRSQKLNELRDVHKIEKCKDCELLFFCRGCRAIPYGYCGNFFAPDPQCWKTPTIGEKP